MPEIQEYNAHNSPKLDAKHNSQINHDAISIMEKYFGL